MKFSPKQPNFPNPSISKPTKVSYTKGKSDVSTINHWFEGKGKKYQSGKFSEEQIKSAFDKFTNNSSIESTSSQIRKFRFKNGNQLSKMRML